jgi:hypothetical protein
MSLSGISRHPPTPGQSSDPTISDPHDAKRYHEHRRESGYDRKTIPTQVQLLSIAGHVISAWCTGGTPVSATSSGAGWHRITANAGDHYLCSSVNLWESATKGSCPTCDFIWKGVSHSSPWIEDQITARPAGWPRPFGTIGICAHEDRDLPLRVEITGFRDDKRCREVVEFYTAEGSSICCRPLSECPLP